MMAVQDIKAKYTLTKQPGKRTKTVFDYKDGARVEKEIEVDAGYLLDTGKHQVALSSEDVALLGLSDVAPVHDETDEIDDVLIGAVIDRLKQDPDLLKSLLAGQKEGK